MTKLTLTIKRNNHIQIIFYMANIKGNLKNNKIPLQYFIIVTAYSEPTISEYYK